MTAKHLNSSYFAQVDIFGLALENVEYMASAGLRQVVACSKKVKSLGAVFSVINVCTETMSIFQLTGIDKKLDIRAK